LVTFPPTLINLIQTTDKTSIRGIHIDFKTMYIFTGARSGNISVLELGLPGKERLIKEISSHKANKKV
jgi:hypothetical protein